MTPANNRPRIATERLDPLAFSKSRAAILSRIRDPFHDTRAQPIDSTSRATGRGSRARSPGTQVGRVAMIMVVNRMPAARVAEEQTSATVAARRISFGAWLRVS